MLYYISVLRISSFLNTTTRAVTSVRPPVSNKRNNCEVACCIESNENLNRVDLYYFQLFEAQHIQITQLT